MAKSIKIPDGELDLARREAALTSRSIAGQVAHWMRLGRAVERSGALDQARLRQALAGQRDPDSLTGTEQEVFVDEIVGHATAGTPEQRRLFQERQAAGLGVGLDDQGTVRHAKTGKA